MGESQGIGPEDLQSLFQQYMMNSGGNSPSSFATSFAGSALRSNPYASAAMTALSLIQTKTAFHKLKELDKKGLPQFSLTEGMKNSIREADAKRGIGFTPEQMASAENKIIRGQTTGWQKAVDQAPNLVGAIQAGINYSNEAAQLDLASRDAAIQQSNVRYSDSLRKEEQNIKNMNTNQEIMDNNRQQAAYGEAGKAGINNLMYGVASLTSNIPSNNTDGTNPSSTTPNTKDNSWFGKWKAKNPKYLTDKKGVFDSGIGNSFTDNLA